MTLAEAVVKATESPADFKFLYDLDKPIVEKIEIIVKEVRGRFLCKTMPIVNLLS